MTFEDKIKYFYLKILYEKFQLYDYEKYFADCGLDSKDIYDPDNLKISDYFFLQNNVDLSRLSDEEIMLLKKFFSNDIKDIVDVKDEMYNLVVDLLMKKLSFILFPDTEGKFICLDGNPFHKIPSDSICFYFHYIRYYENKNIDFSMIFKKLNSIQNELFKNTGIKVSIIPCEETLDHIMQIR